MSDAKVSTDNDLPREAKLVTRKFLEETLKNSEKRDDIIIKDFAVSSATNKGDNYVAVVLRVHVTCQQGKEEKIHHLIGKSLPDNDFVQTLKIKAKIVDKEIMAYKDLFPSFIQYQVNKRLEPLSLPMPRFYHSILNDKDGIVVLQDLCPEGYKIADKCKGLDYDHCKLVMKELAKFHAASYAIKDGNPINLKKKFGMAFMESFFFSGSESQRKVMFEYGIRTSVDVINAMVGEEEVTERVKKLLNCDIVSIMKDFLKAEEPYAVICHGDVWCNNIMFKYDNGEDSVPIDIKLLDFQVLRYALPTTDLAFFFYSSTTWSLRQAHLSDLLQLYHKSFIDTLNHVKVQSSDFTFKKLENMFKKTMLFGVVMACSIILPSILSKQTDIPGYTPGLTEDDAIELVKEMSKTMIGGNSKATRERLVGAFKDALDIGAL